MHFSKLGSRLAHLRQDIDKTAIMECEAAKLNAWAVNAVAVLAFKYLGCNVYAQMEPSQAESGRNFSSMGDVAVPEVLQSHVCGV